MQQWMPQVPSSDLRLLCAACWECDSYQGIHDPFFMYKSSRAHSFDFHPLPIIYDTKSVASRVLKASCCPDHYTRTGQ